MTAHAHATVGSLRRSFFAGCLLASSTARSEPGAAPPTARMLLADCRPRCVACMRIPRVYPEMPENLVAVVQDGWRKHPPPDAGARVALSTDVGVAPGRRHDVLPDDGVSVSTSPAEVLTGYRSGRRQSGSATARVVSRRATTPSAGCCGKGTMTFAGLTSAGAAEPRYR